MADGVQMKSVRCEISFRLGTSLDLGRSINLETGIKPHYVWLSLNVVLLSCVYSEY